MQKIYNGKERGRNPECEIELKANTKHWTLINWIKTYAKQKTLAANLVGCCHTIAYRLSY